MTVAPVLQALDCCSFKPPFSGSSPAQGHADVTRHTVGKIYDLYFQLVAARPKVLLPQLIDFLRRAGECLFPAWLLIIDGAPLVRAQLVGKTKDLNLGQPALHRALDDRYRAPDRLLLGDARGFAEVIDEGLFLGLRLGPYPCLPFGLFRLSQCNFLPHLLGGRQQCVRAVRHAWLHGSHIVPSAFRSGALDNRSSPVNGRLSSKIRKIPHADEKANSDRQVKTVSLRGENRLKLANMMTSQNARTAKNGVGTRFSDSANSKKRTCARSLLICTARAWSERWTASRGDSF